VLAAGGNPDQVTGASGTATGEPRTSRVYESEEQAKEAYRNKTLGPGQPFRLEGDAPDVPDRTF